MEQVDPGYRKYNKISTMMVCYRYVKIKRGSRYIGWWPVGMWNYGDGSGAL